MTRVVLCSTGPRVPGGSVCLWPAGGTPYGLGCAGAFRCRRRTPSTASLVGVGMGLDRMLGRLPGHVYGGMSRVYQVEV